MPKIYHARYEFISRCNSRKTQFSTKGLRKVFDKMNLKMESVLPPFDWQSNSLVQMVRFSGTREEVIKIRTDIADRLRVMTQGNISIIFKLEK